MFLGHYTQRRGTRCLSISLLSELNLNQETETKMTKELLKKKKTGLLKNGMFLYSLCRGKVMIRDL